MSTAISNPAEYFNVLNSTGEKIALTICEDLWNVEDDPLYIHSPMEELIKEKPSFIINIAVRHLITNMRISGKQFYSEM